MSQQAPVMVGRPGDAQLSDQLLSTAWTPRSRLWWLLFAITGAGTLLLVVMVGLTFIYGIGLWGNNIPVGWAFGIINFVWWIGIGHAGTFISAILLVLEQRSRTSINRFAEAMTLFAVVQAGMFPILHLGRPWFAYWLIPYPATMGVWPNFRSALPWDTAAVATYLTVSLLFWYVGLVPDLAAARDRAPTLRRRRIYGIFALGWRGSARHWRHYRVAYVLLASLATPLVISVHSIVSLDFAISLVPGWHSTIFPPLFVAGAIFSGFAMVLTLVIPVRRAFKLHNVITDRHLDTMAKIALVTSWIVAYAYLTEFFLAWYSGDSGEIYYHLRNLPFGPYALLFWVQIVCNCVVPQLFWSRRIRVNPWALFACALAINVGMWIERFQIIVTALARDFLPSSWHFYRPSWVDLGLLTGTICCFLFLFMVFLRLVPFVPLSEMKELRHELSEEAPPGTREVA